MRHFADAIAASRSLRSEEQQDEQIDGFISVERFEGLYKEGKLLLLQFWQDQRIDQPSVPEASWKPRDYELPALMLVGSASGARARRILSPARCRR
jgi:hypothetical protein